MRQTLIAIAVALPALLAGCTDRDKPISWPKQDMTLQERRFEAVWIASEQALRNYGFKIARTDRRARLIVTEPMIGQNAVEFWRKDAASGSDLAESTLQTIYRTAQVEIRPMPHFAQEYEPLVVVHVSRSDKPEHYVRTTNDAYRMFRDPVEKWASSRPAPIKAKDVDQLPNDPRLAEDLALAIRTRARQILEANPPRTYSK